ncbi:MAG: hypothetical protein H6828_10440 [Planctomycetes bacterium]|nr:hypothetical protein [Planctomycetota bacterium]
MTDAPTPTPTPDELREHLRAFGRAYAYDASYLEELLAASPAGFRAFQAAQPLGAFRRELPLEAHWVARVATMQAEDCGACGQLNVRMALEAGVDRELLRALVHAPDALDEALRDVRLHALAVARAEPVDLERVERLRARYGAAGLAELALVVAGCRVYPTLKRALGRMAACAPVSVDV